MSELVFKVPEFVKTASAEDLDLSALDAVIVGGDMRLDTRAGAWQASAKLRKMAMAGENVDPSYERSVNAACSLWGITDADFILNDVPGERIIVKTASDTAEFFIGDDEQLADSIHELLIKRASYPLPFCRECANKLLDYIEKNDSNVAESDKIDLTRLAGTQHFNKEAAAEEVIKRGDYALNHNNPAYAERMYKLASMCDQLDENSSFILTSAVTDAVDLFDQKFGLLNKLASEGMQRIENAAFMTALEALEKSASDTIMVDDENGVPRGRFMVADTRDRMAKWASMNGYSTTTDMNDIVDCVASMPSSLREDFCEAFK